MARRNITSEIFIALVVSTLVVTAYHVWQKRETVKVVDSLSEASIEKGFMDLLQKNPEILKDAYDQGMANKHKRMQEENQKKASELKGSLLKAAINLGGQKGKATVVSFIDPRCPHCQTFLSVLETTSKVSSDAPLYVILTPLLSSASVVACKILLQAYKINKETFFEVNKIITKSDINTPETKEKLTKLGINIEQLMEDKEISAAIQENGDLAEKLSVNGVPTVYLFNGSGDSKLISPMPPEQLTKLIEKVEKTGNLDDA